MKKVYWYLALLLSGVVVTILLTTTYSDPKITFVLTERHHLAIGDRVEMQDVVIGEILDVDFENAHDAGQQYKTVTARIDRRYFDNLYLELDYLVRSPVVSTGLGRIEVVGSGIAPRTPVMPGDRIFVVTPAERFFDDAESAIEEFITSSRPIRRDLRFKLQSTFRQLQDWFETGAERARMLDLEVDSLEAL